MLLSPGHPPALLRQTRPTTAPLLPLTSAGHAASPRGWGIPPSLPHRKCGINPLSTAEATTGANRTALSASSKSSSWFIPPGAWQEAQRTERIGAISPWYVGVSELPPESPSSPFSPHPTPIKVTNKRAFQPITTPVYSHAGLAQNSFYYNLTGQFPRPPCSYRQCLAYTADSYLETHLVHHTLAAQHLSHRLR